MERDNAVTMILYDAYLELVKDNKHFMQTIYSSLILYD